MFFRYRVWNIFLVPLTVHAVLEECRSRARVILDEGRLRVTVPLLGSIAFAFDSFQSARKIVPDPWRFVAGFPLLFAGLLLILEGYHFFSGATVDPISILFAVVLLMLAFQAYRRRDYKALELWFGAHTGWRRHVWSQRKVTFRGREEVLLELKRQVKAAAGQGDQ